MNEISILYSQLVFLFGSSSLGFCSPLKDHPYLRENLWVLVLLSNGLSFFFFLVFYDLDFEENLWVLVVLRNG